MPNISRLVTYALIITIAAITMAAPALAQELPPVLTDPDTRFEHSIVYDVAGKITVDRQLGDTISTGAAKRTKIRGYAEMAKTEYVRIAAHIITVNEVSDWSVPLEALSGLTVTTTIDLCSRPMAVAAEDYSDSTIEIKKGQVINIYHPKVVDGTIKVNRLTDQFWGIRQETDQGHQGHYESEFLAAYGPGPYERESGFKDDMGVKHTYDEKYMWTYDPSVHPSDRDHKKYGYTRGDYYVGNFFDIEQYASLSGGRMSRYISMSNPFDRTLLFEDMSVTGSAKVRESFSDHGLMGGPKAITLVWYDLF